MHQHPPKIPLCFSTRRAKAGQVEGERGLDVSDIADFEMFTAIYLCTVAHDEVSQGAQTNYGIELV